MGAVDTTYTFTATDTITSSKMNNIIDQTTITTDAIIGTTLDVASGKLKIRSAGITSNEMGANSVTTSSITDASITPTKLSSGGPNWTTSTTSLGNAITGSYTASVAPARTGDGATAIQLGAQTGVSSSASITRNSGVDGTLEITNTGTGSITLSASSGVTFGTANMPNPSGTAPIFGVRAWVTFDLTRNSTGGSDTLNTNRYIYASGNVSSVLKTNTGEFEVNFTTDLPSVNYAYSGSGMDTDSTGDIVIGRANAATKTVSKIKLKSMNIAATATNFPEVGLMFIG